MAHISHMLIQMLRVSVGEWLKLRRTSTHEWVLESAD